MSNLSPLTPIVDQEGTSWAQGGGLDHGGWGAYLVEREGNGLRHHHESQVSLPDIYITSAISLKLVHRQQIKINLCKMCTDSGSAGSPYRCNFLVSVYTDQEGI